MDTTKVKQHPSENTSISNIISFLERSELTAIKTLMRKEIKPQILCLIYLQDINPTYVIGGSTDKTIKVWDIVKDTCIKTLSGHTQQVNCLLHLKEIDVYKVISGSEDMSIKIWDLKNNDKCLKTLSFHTDAINSITNFPDYDKNIIASGSSDKDIKIINISSGDCLKTLKAHTGPVFCLLSLKQASGCLLSTGEDKSLRIWNIETEICLKSKIGHCNIVLDLILIDSDTLATCGVDTTIVLWRLTPFEIKKTLTNHTNTVRCLLSLNEAYPGIMLSASEDLTVKTWNTISNNGECISSLKFKEFTVNCFAFLKDYGKHDIATGNTNGTIQLMKFKN